MLADADEGQNFGKLLVLAAAGAGERRGRSLVVRFGRPGGLPISILDF